MEKGQKDVGAVVGGTEEQGAGPDVGEPQEWRDSALAARTQLLDKLNLTDEHRQHLRNWVQALRSGEYVQTRNELRSVNGGLCCLGVACEVAIRDGLNLRVEQAMAKYRYTDVLGCASTTSLPASVREWYGGVNCEVRVLVPWVLVRAVSRTGYGAHGNGGQFSTGMNLNDEWRLTFDQIADCVEYTYLPEDWDAARR
jgi:hypothetical protein